MELRHEKGDKLNLVFKGRSGQWVNIDICVFETEINMRAKKNCHRRQNNQTLIGKAINRMKEHINLNDKGQYIIFVCHLIEGNPLDFDIIKAKKDLETKGAILTDSLEELKRIVQFC
jgi:hypothetical protein